MDALLLRYAISPEQLRKIFLECIFVFDASALLELYAYTVETQKEFFHILESIEIRTWLPHQAMREYLKNRSKSISQQYPVASTIEEILKGTLEKIEALGSHKEGNIIVNTNPLIREIFSARAEIEKANVLSIYEQENDPLYRQIVGFFSDKTGEKYSQEREDEIKAEFQQRFAARKPPGYRDKHKDDPYGDGLFWYQIIDRAIEKGKPIILVTMDQKDDWWQMDENHRKQGPRVELKEEIDKKAHVNFHMQTIDRFMTNAREFLNLEVKQAAINEVKQVMSLLPANDRYYRNRVFSRVQDYWINNVLERSLHQLPLIVLNLDQRPDLIDNPQRMTLQGTEQSARPLPSGTRIVQVYDNVREGLLILGMPGAGKTTLLLELARNLLDRAKQDEGYPIPVVFRLSEWAKKRKKRLTIADWLAEELHTKYGVPHKRARLWIENDQVLPLLDGLDEVVQEHRLVCLEEINIYRREHDLSLVVSSRISEYQDQKLHLVLQNAVVAKPLTPQQIDEYLNKAEKRLGPLPALFQDNPILREMATSPLMLNILVQSYSEKLVSDLQNPSTSITQEWVFENYVEQALTRRQSQYGWKREQIIHWLISLAKYMQQSHLTTFSIDADLQSTWLPRKWRILYGCCIGLAMEVYSGLVGVLVGSLVGGLAIGLIIALLGGLDVVVDSPSGLHSLASEQHPRVWLFIVLISSPLTGLALWPVLWLNAPKLGIATSLIAGQSIALVLWLAILLNVFVRHFILRFLLWQRDNFPWNPVLFLNEVVTRQLLWKRGGSYEFAHPLLFNYLVALDESIPTENISPESKVEV